MSPAAALPADPGALVAQFEAAVDAFELAPSADRLRELERLARELLARLGELSAAAAAAFRAALGRLIGALVSAASGLALPATALAFWWLAFELLAAKGVRAKAAHESEAIVGIVRDALEIAGFDPTGNEPCWVRFQQLLFAALQDYYGDPTMWGTMLDRLDRLIDELLDCIGASRSAVTGNLRGILLARIMGTVAIYVALSLGLSLEEASAATPDRPPPAPLTREDADKAKESGLSSLPYRDGFGCGETGESTPDGPIADADDVDVDPALPLGLFSDADLAAREAALDRWISELDRMREADAAQRAGLDDASDPDGELRGLLGRRIKLANGEAERLRAARQNTRRARRIRGLCGYPVTR